MQLCTILLLYINYLLHANSYMIALVTQSKNADKVVSNENMSVLFVIVFATFGCKGTKNI